MANTKTIKETLKDINNLRTKTLEECKIKMLKNVELSLSKTKDEKFKGRFSVLMDELKNKGIEKIKELPELIYVTPSVGSDNELQNVLGTIVKEFKSSGEKLRLETVKYMQKHPKNTILNNIVKLVTANQINGLKVIDEAGKLLNDKDRKIKGVGEDISQLGIKYEYYYELLMTLEGCKDRAAMSQQFLKNRDALETWIGKMSGTNKRTPKAIFNKLGLLLPQG